jgi:hypothetical protein
MSRIPSSFGWALVALDLHLSPPRELAIVGPPTPTSPVPRSRRGIRAPSSRSGPSDDVPLLAGKGARRRRACGLRLRAIRLPGAGDGPGRLRSRYLTVVSERSIVRVSADVAASSRSALVGSSATVRSIGSGRRVAYTGFLATTSRRRPSTAGSSA